MRLSRLGHATLVLTLTAAMVGLPFVIDGRGSRALVFGWLVFAALAIAARSSTQRVPSVGVDAGERDLDRHAATGLHPAQQ